MWPLGLVTPDGKPAPTIKGRYLNTVVKKGGGAWILASNAAVPPPPAPAK